MKQTGTTQKDRPESPNPQMKAQTYELYASSLDQVKTETRFAPHFETTSTTEFIETSHPKDIPESEVGQSKRFR